MVDTMDQSQRHSQDSVQIASQAGASGWTALPCASARSTAYMNQSVATATEEASTAVAEAINMDINEINMLNQEGVENLQATLRACSDLEQQAGRLKQAGGQLPHLTGATPSSCRSSLVLRRRPVQAILPCCLHRPLRSTTLLLQGFRTPLSSNRSNKLSF